MKIVSCFSQIKEKAFEDAKASTHKIIEDQVLNLRKIKTAVIPETYKKEALSKLVRRVRSRNKLPHPRTLTFTVS